MFDHHDVSRGLAVLSCGSYQLWSDLPSPSMVVHHSATFTVAGCIYWLFIFHTEFHQFVKVLCTPQLTSKHQTLINGVSLFRGQK